LWLLDCGAIKKWEMTSVLCAHYLPANRLAEPEIGLERARVRSFDLAKEARQMGEMEKFVRRPFAKTTANCSNSFCHFHLISSVSRSQRPLIY
jgi:hypothetical protein